ncbi:MAG: xanthine dehydrogenase family protein subunit M [Candidatus Eremiobacteraeota bacterium]|nr:xanthine dehydrogenase family protein subunit M [Candidatus Eremiobacteraeota bacterium]
MNRFRFARAHSPDAAVATVAADPHAAYIAGGTNILDLMKDYAVAPALLVDITALSFGKVESTPLGVRVGALAKMSDVADHPTIQKQFPAIAQALLESASPQLRNMATIGGNLMQRTRCAYFRDVGTACNKRMPGAGCSALEGVNRMHAVLGGSEHCICVHASDLAVALTAFDAIVHVHGPDGDRAIPLTQFYVLPGTTPDRETVLRHGELIEMLELRPSEYTARSTYLKVRDRAAYEFALVSVAAGLDVQAGKIRTARLALGGVAPIPWRAREAEDALAGQAPTRDAFVNAGQIALSGAHGHGENDFKIALAQRAIVRAFETVASA